mgnify:CR=1 FL=1
MQYRSFMVPEAGKWTMGGYQADIHAPNVHTGIVYGERFRGILAKRGERAAVRSDHRPVVTEQFASADELKNEIKEGWNDYKIVCVGNKASQYINGKLMSELVDEDEEMRRADGLLGMQLHVGEPMKVQFKDIKLKDLSKKDK